MGKNKDGFKGRLCFYIDYIYKSWTAQAEMLLYRRALFRKNTLCGLETAFFSDAAGKISRIE